MINKTRLIQYLLKAISFILGMFLFVLCLKVGQNDVTLGSFLIGAVLNGIAPVFIKNEDTLDDFGADCIVLLLCPLSELLAFLCIIFSNSSFMKIVLF